MIQPFHSGVLLRLGGNISDTAIPGVDIMDFHSPWNSQSVEAEVVAISAGPQFMGKEMIAMREDWGEDVREVADLCSLIADVPIEVCVGDTVIFDWRRALDDAEKAYKVEDGMLIVSYSDLIARVDLSGLYPLNGYVFAIPDAYSKNSIAAKEAKGDAWMVIAEGVCVRGWLDEIEPEIGWPPLVGKTIFCDPKAPIAIEAPLFSKYDHGGQRFHLLNRHHIFAYS
jgi:co-chaperonin GroES (HSP10)